MPKKENKNPNKELDRLSKEITELKRTLNQVNEQKETWFEKKQKISNRISDIIRKAKAAKDARNRLTQKVKILKKEREKFHKERMEKIEEIKKLKLNREELLKKYGAKEDISQIRRKINRLDEKIETEPMSFEKEKGIMKNIKTLRKSLKEMKDVTDVIDSVKKLSREIDNIRKDGNKKHGEIQKIAIESQTHHEKVLTLSKEMDSLRKDENNVYKKFFEFKKKFDDVNNELKKKLYEVNRLSSEAEWRKEKKTKKKKYIEKIKIREKEINVEKKMRRGEKITTEDLLVFQKTDIIK